MDDIDFLACLESARTPQAVGAELSVRAAGFGLPTYAIGGLPSPDNPFPTPFMVHNWPPAWHQQYEERGFGPRDPVLLAVQQHSGPLTISEIRNGLAGFMPSPEQLEVLDAARDLGRGEGFVVPIYGPQGYRGIVCFAGEGPEPDTRTRAILRLWAIYAHDRMRILHSEGNWDDGRQRSLTPREVEILSLARNGLADHAIAERLGISVRTVRFHVENAKRNLGCKTRMEAIASAVGQHLLLP